MRHPEEIEPIVIPMTDPPLPPPLPMAPRVRRTLARAWPLVAWMGALAAAVWLYFGASWRGHALAYEDIQEVNVSPSLAGRLATLEIELGQKVEEGDVLATLDTADLDARERRARTELERLKTRVAAQREALRLEQEDRRAQGAARRTTYESEGSRLRALIEKLSTDQAADEAEASALDPQIERLKPLLERKLLTADRLESKLQERAMLTKRIASRTDALRSAGEELSSWMRLAPAKISDSNVEALLLPYELELRTQEARLAELELEREKHRITAPVSGSVNQISARAGEWRAAGAPIVEIVVPRPNRIIAYVTDRQVPAVVVGTPATLRPHDHGGATISGKVVMAGPRIQQVPLRLRTIPTIPQWGRLVTIEVEKSSEPLPGEIYDVRFH
jgi:multidrug resistance efflux pump